MCGRQEVPGAQEGETSRGRIKCFFHGGYGGMQIAGAGMGNLGRVKYLGLLQGHKPVIPGHNGVSG